MPLLKENTYTIEDIYAPVSYTHLDVYKRQALHSLLLIQCPLSYPNKASSVTPYSVLSVSYTHLRLH